ncbi:MAG TPA: TetR/AcrR family transcriptional regulator [Nocardioides sp.]|nr:TetR/AcrR family transcriptional regulator [Nocardioides sp.]
MDPLPHLMLTPDSAARVDMATDLAIPIVAAEGFASVTPRAIAEKAGCSRQAVHQWFGDQEGLRRVVARRFTGRWCRWAQIRAGKYGVRGLLPDSDDVLSWCRVWLGLVELGARDRAVGDLVASIRRCEQDAVAAALTRSSPSGPLRRPWPERALQALVEGLRLQLCHADLAAPGFEGACEVLDHALDAATPGPPRPLA